MAALIVTTFNVRVDTSADGGANRWEGRKELAVRTIKALSPDILGTQEPLPQQVRLSR